LKALHRGLAVTKAIGRPRTLLDEALAYIRQKRADLTVQLDQVDRDMQAIVYERDDLAKQIRFLDEQYQALIEEAAAEKRR
jgi:cell division protein FtsB